MEIKTKTIRAMEILNSLSKVSGDQLGQVAAELVSRRDFFQIIEKSAEIVAAIGGSGVAKEIGKEIGQQISPDQETVGVFANYLVGEAKTGQIFTLERVFNAFPQDSFALQGIAWEKITPEKGKKIDIKILEMKGLNETAEIGIAYEKNPVTQAPNGRSWLVLSYADVKDESGNIIKGVLKPLNKGLIGGATTFSLEMGIIDNSKEYGEIVMGPIDEAGGVTPVFVFDVKVSTDKDGKESIEYGGVSFIPFFTDTLQPSPIEAPKTIIRHAENARARIAESPAPALPAEMDELQKSLEGTNYAFAWNSDGKTIALTYKDPETEETSVIPEIVFDEKGNWKRTYTFETPYGTQAEVTIDSRVDNRDTKIKVVETPEGKKVLDFSAWSLVDGKWEREYKNNKDISYNVSEFQFLLTTFGSKKTQDGYGLSYTDPKIETLGLKYLEAFAPNWRNENGLVSVNGTNEFLNQDAEFRTWVANNLVLEGNGDEPSVIDTTTYTILNFTSGKSAGIYKDSNGNLCFFYIDSNLDDFRNWSAFFKEKNPFN